MAEWRPSPAFAEYPAAGRECRDARGGVRRSPSWCSTWSSRRSAEEALADQLEVQVLALIGAVEPDDAGNLSVPKRLLEPRLRNPGSGLYAEILDASGLPLWRSPSAVGLELAAGRHAESRRAHGHAAACCRWQRGRCCSGVGINWELGPTATPAFQVFAAADLAATRRSSTVSRPAARLVLRRHVRVARRPVAGHPLCAPAAAADVRRDRRHRSRPQDALERGVSAGAGGCHARPQHAAAVGAPAHGVAIARRWTTWRTA